MGQFRPSISRACFPSIEVISGDAGHVTYEVRVPGMLVSDATINGSTYRQFRFPGEGVLCDESLPEPPAVTRITGHAPNAQVTIQAQFSDSVVLSDYLVFPAQPAWTWTYPPAPPPPFAIDSAFYQTNASYPQAREYLDTLGTWRDLGIHVTAVVPFRYNPTSRELVAYTRIILTVTFQGGDGLPPVVARSRHQSYQRVVANFDNLGIGIDESGFRDHFIIVLGDDSPELRDAIEPLRVWKTLRGLEVYTPAVGVDFPAEQYQIRDYLVQHYAPLWETAVLLVGDNNTIPAPDDWVVRNSLINPLLIPPNYPIKMGSNTWYGLVARTPADTWPTEDILVGRLASANPDTVAGYVEKVMRYERHVDPEWPNENLLFVVDADSVQGARRYKTSLYTTLRSLVPQHVDILKADGVVHHNQRIVECLEGGSGVGT
ncbi:MAG: C25 family cysteine peptidase, partial [candidate division WOR-3 bacterium]